MLARTLTLVAAITVAAAAEASVTDTDILQYALTLEHLESAFYSSGLAKFKESDFASGGEQRALFAQIAAHEASHVELLTTVLGKDATKACTYNFPYTDIQGFKALAQVLEGVGVTAYLGAAASISNKDYLTVAGSILTVEARHAAWLATTNGRDPWPGAYDTPLAFSQVFSLAAPFITSCPESNPKLPVKAFPALTASGANGSYKSGQSLTLSVPPSVNASSLFVAFLTGTSVEYVPYTVNQSIQIPPGVNSTGSIYAVVTISNTSATDETTVAGPAVLMFNAQYPANVVPGSSTGNGSGLSGTDGTGKAPGNSSGSLGPRLWAAALGLVLAIVATVV